MATSVLMVFSAGFLAMCRPSHQVERLGLPKAFLQTRNEAVIKWYVGVKRTDRQRR
jgi:hypothetical protein